jgi:hypothetical protein
VLVRRRAEQLLEAADEVERRHPGGAGDLVDPEVAGVEQLARAAQLQKDRAIERHAWILWGMPSVRTTLIFAALLASLATPAAARAECAVAGLVPAVLSRTTTELPDDGGIVVGAFSQGGNLPSGEVAVQPSWRLAVGKTQITPKVDVIAPGLAVYRGLGRAGDVALVDGKGKELAKVRATSGKRPALAAPAVKTLSFEQTQHRRSSTKIAAAFDEIPPSAVALVIADEKGKPRSWGATSRAGKGTVYPLDIASCAALPNGTEMTKAGDKVTLFWVDDAGRVSPATRPIVVTAAP